MRHKQLKQSGLENRSNQTEPLNKEQKHRLWELSQFGTDSAELLQNIVWYFATKLLGVWGCYEARQLQWGDLRLISNENGMEVIQFNKLVSKTRTSNSGHLRTFAPAGAGLQGCFTNHYVRKTMITNLLHADINSNNICQLSSHIRMSKLSITMQQPARSSRKKCTSCREENLKAWKHVLRPASGCTTCKCCPIHS